MDHKEKSKNTDTAKAIAKPDEKEFKGDKFVYPIPTGEGVPFPTKAKVIRGRMPFPTSESSGKDTKSNCENTSDSKDPK